MSSRDFEDAERAMYQVQRRLEGNMHCADCSTPRPEYANLTLGTFICKDCADVHRTMSNRRIKDLLGRDLTMDDVRRMDNVGNDVANRKFLATWDPREFPEPKPSDKEALKNFIWLKYDGSWKKAPPPSQQRQNSGRHDGYYGHGADDRGRNVYGRERDLFRDSAPPPSTRAPPPLEPQRSYWGERVVQAAHRPHPQDDFRRSYSNTNSQQDRFRRAPSSEERFRPPTLGYGRGPAGMPRYEEPYEEEYERHDRGIHNERGELRRREASGSEQRLKERSRRKKAEAHRYASEEENYYSEDGAEEKKKGSRRRGNAAEKKLKSSKSRKKKVVSEEEESETYSDESEESDEDYASRSKKMAKNKKAVKKSSTKRDGRKGGSKRNAYVSSDESEEEDDESPPSPIQKSSRKTKLKSSTAVSVVTNPFEDIVDEKDTIGNEVAVIKPPAQAKAEFDLMSDWMGGETDATTAQSTSSSLTAAVPQQPAVQQQQPAMQMPIIAPPMSMYGGLMPQPRPRT